MKRYHTGSKNTVLQNMAMCAIRDQETLIDALKSDGKTCPETEKAIEESQLWIEDFQRIMALVEKAL